MGGTNMPYTMADMLSNLRQRVGILERRAPGSLVNQLFPSPFVLADLDALPSAANYIEGARFLIDSLNVEFQQVDGVWVQQGPSKVSSVADRNAEYAKAGGAYLTAWVECLVTSELTTYKRIGSNWAKWHKPLTSWTPTLTGATVIGNGTLSGFYSIVAGLAVGSFFLTRGSSTTTTGFDPRFLFPETPHSSMLVSGTVVGDVAIRDVSASATFAAYTLIASTFTAFQVAVTVASDGQLGGTNTTVPITWQTSDTVRGDFAFPVENSF